MLEGKLSNGFEYKISDDALNDYEVLEVISELKEDNSQCVKLAKLLLGNNQHEALKEHCKIDGKVKMDMMLKSIHEILNANQSTKN